MTFDRWMVLVDEHLDKLTGMSHLDLPDWHYHDVFDAGYSPLRAARGAIDATKDW